ncbi:MAG: TRAP transporter substrate-binding protein DctP [Spirochaetales bacterium]|nr:TRAP transporter substrate-binding protein DctP [Spirochaetales bacterium]
MRHPNNVVRFPLLLAALFLAGSLGLSAVTIKIATLAPAGSPWVDSLRRLAGDLERSSDGTVSFKIYAGGAAGEEADMIRKMRIGQLQGAALTQLGLSLLEPGLLALSTPFLIQDEEELDRVMARLRPEYSRRLEEQGFQLLSFLKAGWVHFFGRQAVGTPGELRGQRLGLPDGDADFVEIWRSMGFSAFSLPMGDLLVGLQSGMVDAYYSPPAVAASFQWFALTPHMSEMRIAPVVGGILLTARAFQKIPEELRPLVRERFLQLDREINRGMTALEQDALTAMLRRGLIVDPVAPQARREWEELGQRGAQVVIGRVFTRTDYELVASAVRERSTQP